MSEALAGANPRDPLAKAGKENPPARTSERRANAGLLVVEANSRGKSRVATGGLAALPQFLRSGDIIVLNDAATLPASFSGIHARTALPVEVRLAEPAVEREVPPESGEFPSRWNAVLFGAGSWRSATEDRPSPPRFRLGDRINFGREFYARVAAIDPAFPRWLTLEFEPPRSSLLTAMYAHGRPIQYSYQVKSLEIWDVSTPFAAQPVALEAPSASLHFTWDLVFRLRAAGIGVVTITHAAGISSTGDDRLDARLPLAERYTISSSAAAAINLASAGNHRIVAVGTGAMRALEAAYSHEAKGVVSGSGLARNRLSQARPAQVVSGLVTGMHDHGTSHLDLLASLVFPGAVEGAYAYARKCGFLWHEFGDLTLILK